MRMLTAMAIFVTRDALLLNQGASQRHRYASDEGWVNN